MTDAARSEPIELIAFACSPRVGGNSDLLLEAAIEGAEEAGGRVQRFDLRDMEIAPCRHCGECSDGSGWCIVQDDMQRLYAPLRRADRLILASPVFFMCLTAQAKSMIDRCQPLWVLRNLGEEVAGARHERGALYLGVGGNDIPHLFDASRTVLRSWYWTLQVFKRSEVTLRGVDERGAILRHPDVLDTARDAGLKIAAIDLMEE